MKGLQELEAEKEKIKLEYKQKIDIMEAEMIAFVKEYQRNKHNLYQNFLDKIYDIKINHPKDDYFDCNHIGCNKSYNSKSTF